nr:unnamed protein product [Callosobruchus analis]
MRQQFQTILIFRHSLESISEYKAKHTFIPYYATNNTSQDISSSLESLSPEQADYAALNSLTSSGGTSATPRGSLPSSSRSRSSRSSDFTRGSLPSSGVSERGSIPSDGTMSRSSIPSSYLGDRQESADSQFSSGGEGKEDSKINQPSYLTVEELKETDELTRTETQLLREQIEHLKPTKVKVGYLEMSIHHTLLMTMVDGKVCNSLTQNRSSQTCYICGATPKQMNIQSENVREDTRENYSFGLSTLHSWIRCFECLLHISYRLDVKSGKHAMTLRRLLFSTEKLSYRSDSKKKWGCSTHT